MSFILNIGDANERLQLEAEQRAKFGPGLAALRLVRPGKLVTAYRERFESDGGCVAPPVEAIVPAVAQFVHEMLVELIAVLEKRGDDASDLSRLRARLAMEARMGNLRGAEHGIRDAALAIAEIVDDAAIDDPDYICPDETRAAGMVATRSWEAYCRRVSGAGTAMAALRKLSQMVDKLAAQIVPIETADGAAAPVASTAPAAAEPETVEHILRRRPRRKAEAADKKDS